MTDQQGIRKAAVFLNGLDWETAGMLLKRLPPEESRAIRREMVAVEGISPNEINKTVKQFLKDTKYDKNNLPKKTANTQADNSHKTVFSEDGMDLFELSGPRSNEMTGTYHAAHEIGNSTCETATVATPSEQETAKPVAETVVTESPAEQESGPRRFDYLERRSAFDTAAFLAEEGEQLIAVVLSQLTPRYSGDVLACFEQSLKRDLIRRLAKLDATDETILDEIDAVLKDRLKREVEDLPKSKPGLALLERILQVVENELDNDLGNDIILGLNEIDLEEQEAAYYDQYDEYVEYVDAGEDTNDAQYYAAEEMSDDMTLEDVTLEDLERLDDQELAAFFRSLDHDTVVETLLSADDAYFVERVLGLFPVYEQVSLREMLRFQTSR